MTELQIAIWAMCLMGVAFAWCIKLMFDAFVVHLQRQSELTTRAVKNASDAIELNGRMLASLSAVVSTQQGSDK